MSFSDLVHRVEADVSSALLPRDAPSDTREADALAKAAAGVAVTVDPELSPLFDRVGVLGDYVEQALTELGTVLGDLKGIIATRAQQVPPPSTPVEAVNPDPSAAPAATDAAPVDSGAGSGAPSDAASASAPASPTTDSTSAGMAAVGESSATTPAPSAETPSSVPTSEAPGTQTDELAAAQAGPDAATAAAESAFGALTPEERARFDTDEELDPMGSIATADADANAGTDAGIAAATGSTPPPPA